MKNRDDYQNSQQTLTEKIQRLERDGKLLREKLELYQGYLPAIAKLSIDDCEKYENDLDRLRGQIRKHKVSILSLFLSLSRSLSLSLSLSLFMLI